MKAYKIKVISRMRYLIGLLITVIASVVLFLFIIPEVFPQVITDMKYSWIIYILISMITGLWLMNLLEKRISQQLFIEIDAKEFKVYSDNKKEIFKSSYENISSFKVKGFLTISLHLRLSH